MVACLRHSMIVCRRRQALHEEHFCPLSLRLRICIGTVGPELRHGSYGFAGTIVPNDECEWLVELDNMGVVRTEAPDALYEHLHDMVMPHGILHTWYVIFDKSHDDGIKGP